MCEREGEKERDRGGERKKEQERGLAKVNQDVIASLTRPGQRSVAENLDNVDKKDIKKSF